MGSEMNEKSMHTISVLVANKPGVLVRVATVFARRNFNIESLVVSRVHKPGQSRMTIVTSGNDDGIEQIVKQLDKLIDVIHVFDYDEDAIVSSEMALVKVHFTPENRTAVLEIGALFRAFPKDVSKNSIIFQVTGESHQLDAMEELLDGYGIIEIMRTGKLILHRGEEIT